MSELIDIYIGRQPIFNTKLEMHAYELLFRNCEHNNHAPMLPGDTATAQVMLNAFGDMNLKDIASDHKVFINFTEGLLLRENLPFFPSRQVVIEVLEDVKLSAIIAKDVSLSQKLLKFLAENINSKYPINSVHDGVMRFGLDRLQSWASMLALAGVDDKPIELFRMSLTRAKFCELVGERIGDHSKNLYFTVGLFSMLDAVMDVELTELLSRLKLDPIIVTALTDVKSTNLSKTLSAIKAMERGQTEFALPEDMTIADLSKFYLQAMQFSHSVYQNLPN
ncbi:MAG: HDOD domain-containing protein [Thiomicrospira sp.]|uniref:EAL and HDOD domain-containing protein n=1 Tax=Thiomicrospira sp. TaxID=935 RepID=UPI0019EB5732|nr:HDOD domain-containing protein [Thiomicrospira sp.]MBE0494706.1 HDOD domain-containing protein [Thiomicrospira sp.]